MSWIINAKACFMFLSSWESTVFSWDLHCEEPFEPGWSKHKADSFHKLVQLWGQIVLTWWVAFKEWTLLSCWLQMRITAPQEIFICSIMNNYDIGGFLIWRGAGQIQMQILGCVLLDSNYTTNQPISNRLQPPLSFYCFNCRGNVKWCRQLWEFGSRDITTAVIQSHQKAQNKYNKIQILSQLDNMRDGCKIAHAKGPLLLPIAPSQSF